MTPRRMCVLSDEAKAAMGQCKRRRTKDYDDTDPERSIPRGPRGTRVMGSLDDTTAEGDSIDAIMEERYFLETGVFYVRDL